MKTEDAKAAVDAVKELSDSYADLIQAFRGTAMEVRNAKKLWRSENKSVLIKVGLALIAFPDPTISDVVGGMLVAAGAVQAGIRRNTLHAEDVARTFQNTLREVWTTRQEL